MASVALPRPFDALTGAVMFVDEDGVEHIYIPATMSQVEALKSRLFHEFKSQDKED